MKCRLCGKPTKEKDHICLKCKVNKETSKSEDSIVVASILALIFPGMGQVYNHEFIKAIFIFIGTIIGLFLFIVPGVFVYLYGIYDAYKMAKAKIKGG